MITRFGRPAIFAALLCVMSIALFGSAAGAQKLPGASVGGIGIKVAEIPPGAKDPRANIYIVDSVKPGATIRSKLLVENNTDQSRAVDFYAGPATNDADGWKVGDREASNQLVTWTKVKPSQAKIPAGGSQLVDVEIQVPSDASRGERYGVIWASTSGKGDLAATNRVGVREYVYVGPGGAPPASYEIESISGGRTTGNELAVAAKIRNTGERALDLRGEVRLTDGPAGLTAGPFAVTGAVPIGQEVSVYTTVPSGLPLGPWTATVKLDFLGDTQEQAATITFPTEPGALTEGSPISTTSVIILVLLALLLLVAAAFAVRWYLKRRRLATPQDPPV